MENDGDLGRSAPLEASDGKFNVSSPDPLATTVATFEFTTVQTGNQMTSKVFACPSTPSNHPAVNTANTQLDETALAPSISNWAVAVGTNNALAMPGYCYDWALS